MGATGENLDKAIDRADERLRRMEQEAQDLILFADGIEEGGMRTYAQRARVVARDLLDAAGDLRAERSARVAMQHQRDRLLEAATRRSAPTSAGAPFACLGCSANTAMLGEYYMLHDEVWLAASGGDDGMLCIGCLEQRLGRQLTSADFADAPINRDRRSERMLDRLGDAA